MKTPNKICLIYVGDIDNEICWCDSVPSNDIDEAEDVVYYIKQSEFDILTKENEELTCCHNSAERHVKSLVIERDRLREALVSITDINIESYEDGVVMNGIANEALNHKGE